MEHTCLSLLVYAHGINKKATTKLSNPPSVSHNKLMDLKDSCFESSSRDNAAFFYKEHQAI